MGFQSWKAPVYRYPQYVALFILEKIINLIYYYYYFTDGGVPTLNMLMVFMNWSISSWSIYTKDVYNLTTETRAIYV